MADLISAERIDHAILTIRGQRVMLDADLAALYGVEVRALNQAVRRNLDRFPGDFAFVLTAEEWAALRSQAVILNPGRGQHRKYPPFVFTEHGAVMLASVLSSPVAVAASIEVARAFVRLRRLMALEGEIRQRLESLEAHAGNVDSHLAAIYDAIRLLMEPPQTYLIGFRPDV